MPYYKSVFNALFLLTILFSQACSDPPTAIHLKNTPLPVLERHDYRHFAISGLGIDSAGKLWGVGENGTVQYYDSLTDKWETQYTGTDAALESLYAIGQEKWAVGQNGTILHYDNHQHQWQREESHTNEFLSAIDGWGNDIWVVGEKGTILHYDLTRRLRFYFDTLAEYVAAVYYCKKMRAGHMPPEFTIADPDNLNGDSAGFRLAFREVRRYYER